MPDEPRSLRTEVEELLASAAHVEERHHEDLKRRDQLHVGELQRRDERHIGETAARDTLHMRELESRGDLHAREVQLIRHALETRDVIGQAKGVIMASMGCTAAEAFQLIVKQSQHENRKATEVAAEIVQRVAKRAPPNHARLGTDGEPDSHGESR